VIKYTASSRLHHYGEDELLDYDVWNGAGEGPWDQILPKVHPPVSVHCSVDVGLSQLRAIVKWSRSSPQRRQKWKEEQKAELPDGDRAVMLILDVRTRWSSTYATVLQRALRFQRPLIG
jgi:hypothetical protein